MMFPHAAKKTSLLMGLWKDLSAKKVVMTNASPRSEKTEQTFSVISTARICWSEKDIVDPGKGY
jgi:hypothetical protein